MTEVTLADAYREACTALGEAVVQQRILAQRAAMLEAQLAALNTEPQAEPSTSG